VKEMHLPKVSAFTEGGGKEVVRELNNGKLFYAIKKIIIQQNKFEL
jgi:hypothetical protein